MSARNIFDLPEDLPAEYALIWAVVERAKLDARYTQRPGVMQPDVLPEEKQGAIEFLQDFLGGLRSDSKLPQPQPVCA